MLRASFFSVIDQSLNGTMNTNALSCDPCPKDCCPANTTCSQSYVEGVGYDYSCISSDMDYTDVLYIFMGIVGVGVGCLLLTCCCTIISKCQSNTTRTELDTSLINNVGNVSGQSIFQSTIGYEPPPVITDEENDHTILSNTGQ